MFCTLFLLALVLFILTVTMTQCFHLVIAAIFLALIAFKGYPEQMRLTINCLEQFMLEIMNVLAFLEIIFCFVFLCLKSCFVS